MPHDPPKPRRIRLGACYAALEEAGRWRDLPGCPGRKVLIGASELSPRDLLGEATPIHVFQTAAAEDPVHVAVVPGGGLLSYAKPSGDFVHTLNTPAGLARKLDQLGISLED